MFFVKAGCSFAFWHIAIPLRRLKNRRRKVMKESEKEVMGDDVKNALNKISGAYGILTPELNCKSKFQCRSKFHHPLKSDDYFKLFQAYL